jgi:hypothetical protein
MSLVLSGQWTRNYIEIYILFFYNLTSYRSYASVSGTTTCNIISAVQIYLYNFCFSVASQSSKSFTFNTYSSSYSYEYTYSKAFCASSTYTTTSVYFSTCKQYLTYNNIYASENWDYYSVPTSKPTFLPVYSITPSRTPIVPTVRPTSVPTYLMSGWAFFNSYSSLGCNGSISSVTAFPLGSCVPSYNQSNGLILYYTLYSCDTGSFF